MVAACSHSSWEKTSSSRRMHQPHQSEPVKSTNRSLPCSLASLTPSSKSAAGALRGRGGERGRAQEREGEGGEWRRRRAWLVGVEGREEPLEAGSAGSENSAASPSDTGLPTNPWGAPRGTANPYEGLTRWPSQGTDERCPHPPGVRAPPPQGPERTRWTSVQSASSPRTRSRRRLVARMPSTSERPPPSYSMPTKPR